MSSCPCGRRNDGRPLPLDRCCGPFLDGAELPQTCEQLMRSRYTAFVLGDGDHLWRTWHPRTRPEVVDTRGPRWTGLRVIEASGGPGEVEGTVEFEAEFVDDGLAGVHRERSRFSRRGGRWMYVDGSVTGGAGGLG